MFKSAITKLPTLFLALVACMVTVSGPVRVITIAQESETEAVDLIEIKEFYVNKHESRKLRHKHIHFPVTMPEPLEELRTLPILSEFNPLLLSSWQSSPPILRGPPA